MTADAVLDRTPALPRTDATRALNTVAGGRTGDIARMSMEIVKLGRGPGRLSKEEYFQFRLFDRDIRWPAKLAFVGAELEKVLHGVINDASWGALAHDKMVFYALAGALGLPVPETLGVWRHGWHAGAPFPVFKDADEATELLRNPAHYPLFGKPVAEMRSTGVVHLASVTPDGATVTLKGGRTVAVDDLVDDLSRYAGDGYLFQRVLAPGSDASRMAGDAVTTLRLVVTVENGTVRPFRALWKLPVGDNPADNFWRKGNIACAVNRDSGTIERAVCGSGLEQQQMENHPETSASLVGACVPDYEAALDLATRAATALPGIAMQAWDIALTDRGPVIMEVNIGGDFSLPQSVNGMGMLDEEFIAFIERRANARGFSERLSKLKLRRALVAS